MSPQLEGLLRLVPVTLRNALRAVPDDDAIGMARHFLHADEDDQAGMLAFVESGGPEKHRQLGVRHREGTPTAADLEDWAGD